MNTVNLYRYIKSITDQMPLVHSYSNKSVYDYWNTEEVKYGSVVFSVKSVSAREDTTSYNGILYFGDRLLEDRSNVEDIYADATTTLQTILNTLAESDVVEVSYPVSITYFEQEFADQLAGAYADVNLIVRGDVGCDGLIPALIYPNDNFDPENYYTKDQVDSILARYDSILDDKIVDFVKETDLAEYVSKTELEEKGYLDHIPSNYVTDAKLSDVLKDKAYLTEIPEGYITENELDVKLQKGGYLTEIPANYVTEAKLAEQGYLTEIPPQYVTETELGERGYLDHVPDNYVTKQALEERGYLTEIPARYVTEAKLAEQGYLTEIPPQYVTETELAKLEYVPKDYVDSLVGEAFHSDDYYTKDQVREGFATKAYVADEIVKIQTGGQVDLTGYVTKLELEDRKYLTEVPSKYVTETELAEKGFLTEIPSKYVTEAELEDRKYLTEIPSYYVTESELSEKGYLTEIPSKYVTESELAAQGYATKEYVKQQVANVEVDLTDYATKSYVDAEIDKIQAGDVDLSDYYTKTESNNRFATKAYVAEEIAKVQSGGSIDLSGYVTDQELEDALKNVEVDLSGYYTRSQTDAKFTTKTYVDEKVANVEVDLTGYATEVYVNGLVGDINSILNSVLNDI